jgi:hypothetical protein
VDNLALRQAGQDSVSGLPYLTMINHKLRRHSIELSRFEQLLLIDSGTDVRTINWPLYMGTLANIEDVAHLMRVNAVAQMRDLGLSWEVIGKSLGISRQAAWEQYSK